MDRFELTDVQAQAIVDMRLRALTGLEREKLEAEYAELMEKIRKLKAILADRNTLLRVIVKKSLRFPKNTVTTEEQQSDLTHMTFLWKT